MSKTLRFRGIGVPIKVEKWIKVQIHRYKKKVVLFFLLKVVIFFEPRTKKYNTHKRVCSRFRSPTVIRDQTLLLALLLLLLLLLLLSLSSPSPSSFFRFLWSPSRYYVFDPIVVIPPNVLFAPVSASAVVVIIIQLPRGHVFFTSRIVDIKYQTRARVK